MSASLEPLVTALMWTGIGLILALLVLVLVLVRQNRGE